MFAHVWTILHMLHDCFPCFITDSHVNYHQTLCHELHGMFYMLCQMWQELQENCAINAPNGKSSKTAVLVILSMRSLVLHRTAEPQEALWHWNNGYICFPLLSSLTWNLWCTHEVTVGMIDLSCGSKCIISYSYWAIDFEQNNTWINVSCSIWLLISIVISFWGSISYTPLPTYWQKIHTQHL